MKTMNKHIRQFVKRKAESLVEVIIAIFVVSLGASVATGLIVTSLQSNSFSRDNLIALNLVEEGIEAMRAIRDTNWLKYGYDKEGCWNLLPSAPACPAASPNEVISDGYYTVELDANNSWILQKYEQPLALDQANATNDNYQLKVVTRNGAFFYAHNTLPPPSQFVEAANHPHNGRFYRMLQVSNATAESMNIRAIVFWRAQGTVHNISLESQLTNYQQIKK